MAFHRKPSREAKAAVRDMALTPFWLDDPQAPMPGPILAEDLSTDLLVVGAGFTGLWTALLAREQQPDRDVVIVDAGLSAHAASGRNGGFVHASLTHGFGNGYARWPAELEQITAMGHANLVGIRDTVTRYGIDCDWRDAGELEIAYAAHQEPDLQARPALAQRFGEHFEWLDPEAVQSRVRSPLFRGALFEPHGVALVNPAQLAWGLRAACIQAGVRIFEHTEVQQMHRHRGAVTVSTPLATIGARRVALATNAFPSLIPSVRRRIVPVYDYVLVTEPLSDAQWASIGWDGFEGLTGAGNRFHYARRTADGRILWGGYDAVYHRGSAMGPQFEHDPATYALLAEHFSQAFPQLGGVRFSHAWGGAIDTCSRFSPFWGTAHDGRVAYVAGFTGLGVGSSRFAAQVMLDTLDDKPTAARQLEMVRTTPIAFPPEPLRSAAVSLTQYSLAREDDRGGRRNLWLQLLDRIGVGFDS